MHLRRSTRIHMPWTPRRFQPTSTRSRGRDAWRRRFGCCSAAMRPPTKLVRSVVGDNGAGTFDPSLRVFGRPHEDLALAHDLGIAEQKLCCYACGAQQTSRTAALWLHGLAEAQPRSSIGAVLRVMSVHRPTSSFWTRDSMKLLPVCAGEPPSVSAYGAIVAGFARRQDAPAGLDVFRRFLVMGGAPDKMMYDTILSLCIKCEEYKSARQVRWWP